tara:strand:- start:383 stop:550 length:168 start_codon:yes stop_codon:yes gene_type:complete
MRYLLDRLKEPSTWRGFIALLAAFGLTFDPAQTAALVAALIAIAGVYDVFSKSKK